MSEPCLHRQVYGLTNWTDDGRGGTRPDGEVWRCFACGVEFLPAAESQGAAQREALDVATRVLEDLGEDLVNDHRAVPYDVIERVDRATDALRSLQGKCVVCHYGEVGHGSNPHPHHYHGDMGPYVGLPHAALKEQPR